MSDKLTVNRVQKKTERTAEERARLKAIRDKFQKEKPTLEQLAASGDYEMMSHRDYLELLGLSATLRQEREKAGLSLNDLAERSGMDKAFLSKLENGQLPNLTVATLLRYAAALGKRLVVSMASVAKNSSS